MRCPRCNGDLKQEWPHAKIELFVCGTVVDGETVSQTKRRKELAIEYHKKLLNKVVSDADKFMARRF